MSAYLHASRATAATTKLDTSKNLAVAVGM